MMATPTHSLRPGKQTFKFLSPFALEECKSRLEARSERPSGLFASKNKLLIRVSILNEDNYKVGLYRDVGSGLNVEAICKLSRRGQNSTFVSGFAQVSLSTRLVGTILLSPSVFCLLLSLQNFFQNWWLNIIGLIPILYNAAFWIACAQERGKFIEIISDTLPGKHS